MGTNYLRSPKTANEKRGNAAYRSTIRETGFKIKGRVRTKGTSSRLADVYDDKEVLNKHRGKKTWAIARKAKEAERKIAMAA